MSIRCTGFHSTYRWGKHLINAAYYLFSSFDLSKFMNYGIVIQLLEYFSLDTFIDASSLNPSSPMLNVRLYISIKLNLNKLRAVEATVIGTSNAMHVTPSVYLRTSY